ncbi:MAG: hypothetical protein M3T49_00545 [Candidatus Eremiobacteraeota bacterium]|nr:hypothetical protein [Candidatus Eremiobacteraeota bacterium]
MRQRALRTVTALTLALSLSACIKAVAGEPPLQGSAPSSDQARIAAATIHELNPRNDRSNVVHIYHIIVFERFALTDWTARQGGGKTALALTPTGRWRVIGVGGLNITAAGLRSFGVPAHQARALTAKMRQAWEED